MPVDVAEVNQRRMPELELYDGLSRSFGTFFEHYLATRNPSQNTIKSFKPVILKFLQKCSAKGRQELSEITGEDVIEYLNGLDGTRTSTKKLHEKYIRIFFRYAFIFKLCEDKPVFMAYKGTTDIPRAPQKDLSKDEMRKMVRASMDFTETEWLLFYFLSNIPLRIGELASLKISDIDWESKTFSVAKSKNHKTRILPLPQWPGDFKKKLSAFCGERDANQPLFHLSDRTLRVMVQNIFHKSGIEAKGRGSHAFRHTVIRNMLKGNIPVAYIAELAGNTPEMIYKVYVNGVGMDDLKFSVRTYAKLMISDFGQKEEPEIEEGGEG